MIFINKKKKISKNYPEDLFTYYVDSILHEKLLNCWSDFKHFDSCGSYWPQSLQFTV